VGLAHDAPSRAAFDGPNERFAHRRTVGRGRRTDAELRADHTVAALRSRRLFLAGRGPRQISDNSNPHETFSEIDVLVSLNDGGLDRLELSRLVHRFGLGPKPGEYLQLLAGGIPQARAKILARRSDPGLNALVTPPFPTMGQAPSDPTASAAYWKEVYDQSVSVAMWWMDRMVLADYPFVERMTWFWHGHWATSISKVTYACR